MENLDLDLENYDLDDIMNLFHLNYQFNKGDLKQAYKIVLKTHPDKSGLPDTFFLFFMKAYKILSRIYYFRYKKQNKNTEYTSEIDDAKAQLLHKINGKPIDEFNHWFNEMFEKAKVRDDENDTGYGEWYRSDKDINNKKISLNEFGNEFEKIKQKCKALVVHQGISEVDNNDGYNLSREKPKEYASAIFSKLKYEDLKKAHTETVVPVTQQDFENKRKFKNMDSLKQYRNRQNVEPFSLKQSREYLKSRQQKTDEIDTRRIYGILKRDEEIERNNQLWWSHLKQLTNE